MAEQEYSFHHGPFCHKKAFGCHCDTDSVGTGKTLRVALLLLLLLSVSALNNGLCTWMSSCPVTFPGSAETCIDCVSVQYLLLLFVPSLE